MIIDVAVELAADAGCPPPGVNRDTDYGSSQAC